MSGCGFDRSRCVSRTVNQCPARMTVNARVRPYVRESPSASHANAIQPTAQDRYFVRACDAAVPAITPRSGA